MEAQSAMTRDVVCVTADDNLADAFEIMTEWEIRHLPVLGNGRRLTGILSDRDILRLALPDATRKIVLPRLAVGEAMTPEPLTCGASASLAAVGRMMLDHKIDCVPVVTPDRELLGLITAADFVALVVERERETMTRPLPFRFEIHRGVRRRYPSA
jgi:acetoin utilization protein AcuB